MSKNKNQIEKAKYFNYETSLFFGLKEKMTDEQDSYTRALLNPSVKVVAVNAKAGSGKTTLAVAAAKILVDAKQYDGLLYIFAPVEENEMGFTPGDLFEKERKYHGPLLDALEAIGEKADRCLYDPTKETVAKEANKANKTKAKDTEASSVKPNKYWVTAISHIFLRGRNLINKVVIIDEAQNFTVSQLRKILTRCHDNCKVILIGHTGQCDIAQDMSGFKKYLEHLETLECGAQFVLTKSFRGELAEWADNIE